MRSAKIREELFYKGHLLVFRRQRKRIQWCSVAVLIDLEGHWRIPIWIDERNASIRSCDKHLACLIQIGTRNRQSVAGDGIPGNRHVRRQDGIAIPEERSIKCPETLRFDRYIETGSI